MRRPQLSFLLGFSAAACLLCLSTAQPAVQVVTDGADPYATAFEQFIQEFEKDYTDAERPARFAAFKANYDVIQSRNAQNHSYTLGITAFADLTPAEFAAQYGGGLKSGRHRLGATAGLPFLGEEPFRNVSVPASVDWRSQGAVSSVKSQGQCGACWAFAGAAAIEGSWQIATGALVSLSVQQIIDCSVSLGTGGCKGASIEDAIQYSTKAKLTNEASYTYKMAVGTCKTDDSIIVIPQGGVVGYKLVKTMDDQALMEAVAKQPVAVGVDANENVFQLYKGGILSDDACGKRIDHAVLLIGYGTADGQDYWLIKNSWGTGWGEQGYGRLARGKSGGGECGITASAPVFAVVDGSKAKPINIKPTLIAAGVAVGIMSVAALGCYVRSRLRSRRAREAPLLPPSSQAGGRVAPQATATQAPAAAPTLPRSGGQRLGGTKGTQAGGSRLVQPQDIEASAA